MKRSFIPSAFTTCAGILLCGAVAVAAPAASSNDGDAGQGRPQQQQSSSASSSSAPRAPATNPPPISDQRVPLPQGGPASIGTDRLPDVPAPRDRTPDRTPGPPQRKIPPNPNPQPSGANDRPMIHDPPGPNPGAGNPGVNDPGDRTRDGDRDRDRNRDRDHDRDRDWRHRRPPIVYNNYWTYDPYRYYNDRYGWDYDPGYANPPAGGGDPRPAADREPAGPAPGAMLPPDDLLDDGDVSPALRKALDASAPYREATAQLVRAWAEYARAAEQVLQRLKGERRYQLALAKLRDAEDKLAAVRDRADKLPAVNVVSATQAAMLARREVRKLEQQAIDADPAAKRAKQQVDQAVERRKKIRDDIASKLPPEAKDAGGAR